MGNYDAILTGHLVRNIIQHAGVKPERFSLDWASAAEAQLFVELITKFTGRIKELGPLGEAEGIARNELKVRLSAARSAVESHKLRTRIGKLAKELRHIQDYSPDLIEEKMAEKLNEAIIKEMDKHLTQRA